jgi:hypothetical protein
VIGNAFTIEACFALNAFARPLCPWGEVLTPIESRFLYDGTPNGKRQADLMAHIIGDAGGPCVGNADEGAVVLSVSTAVAASVDAVPPPAALSAGKTFSPADTDKVGVRKYFVGEAYCGATPFRVDKLDAILEKAAQLDSLLSRLVMRWADRHLAPGAPQPLVESIVGVAVLVLTSTGFQPTGELSARRTMQKIVCTALQERLQREMPPYPSLARLSSFGRFVVVVLSEERCPQTVTSRNLVALQKQIGQVQQQLSALGCRLPPIQEGGDVKGG